MKTQSKPHGGSRQGSGRTPKQSSGRHIFSTNPELKTSDPEKFLRALMADEKIPVSLRTKSALALYGNDAGNEPSGLKSQRQRAAEQAASGNLAPRSPPKLALITKPETKT